MSPPVLVIFGARVRADGSPSLALARRVRFALAALQGAPDTIVFCSGSAGAEGPSEASVMARELKAAGLAPERLVLDEASRDTLATAIAAARFLKARGASRCIACSDAYHLPRIRLLLAAFGVRADPAPTPAALGRPPWRQLAYMSVRELAAIPYDLTLAVLRRGKA